MPLRPSHYNPPGSQCPPTEWGHRSRPWLPAPRVKGEMLALLSSEGLCRTFWAPSWLLCVCVGGRREGQKPEQAQRLRGSQSAPSRLLSARDLRLGDGEDGQRRQGPSPLWGRARPQLRVPGNVQCTQECAGSPRPTQGPGRTGRGSRRRSQPQSIPEPPRTGVQGEPGAQLPGTPAPEEGGWVAKESWD